MKKSLTLLGLALFASPVLADGFDASVVPANAGRLIHLDLSGLQASGLWRHLEESGVDIALDDLEEIEDEFGLNPLTDIRSVTLYDTGKKLEHQAAVLIVNARVDQALERLKQESEYRAVVAGGLTVHSWSEGRETQYAYVHERGPDERAVLLADDTDLLLDGLGVLLGEGASMASGRSKISARPERGTFLFAAMAGGLDDVGLDRHASALLGKAESGMLQVGANDQSLFLTVSLVTETVDEAAHLIELVRGARALAQLVGGNEIPVALLDLLDTIRFNQRENEVSVDIRISFELLNELAEEF